MQLLWPPGSRDAISDAELEALYRYPLGPAAGTWLAVNSVTSIDGAIELEGRSAGLSTPPDRRVYQLGSDLADVVLLGAGTAHAEQYPGLRPSAASAERRRRHGLEPVAPLAVVSSGHSLPADAPALVDVITPSIVVTCAAAGADQHEAWRRAGARVIVAGDRDVDLATAVDELAAIGLRRIDCEGGPRLVGHLLARDLVDELRLSISPMVVAGAASRVASSSEPLPAPARFSLASLLLGEDTMLTRYLAPGRDDGGGEHGA